MQHSELDLIVFYFDLEMLGVESIQRRQVRLIIVHRRHNQAAETVSAGRCIPGEEVTAAFVIWKGKSYRLPLSTTHLILLDYLCRHRGVAQSAAQIAVGLDSELFYLHHGSNARGGTVVNARSSRTAVRKQVERVRAVMAELFEMKHLPLCAEDIICSQPTSTREVKYQIRAKIVFEH
jgi:hypothetical protein